MSFFDEDAQPEFIQGRIGEFSIQREEPDLVKESVILASEVVGALIGAWAYQRMGAPKWVAYAIVGIELRLSRILRAVSR